MPCAHLSIVSGIPAFHVNPPCRPCRSTPDTVTSQKSIATRLPQRVSPWFKFRCIVRLHPVMLRPGQLAGEIKRDDPQHLLPGNPVGEVVGSGRDGLIPADCPVPVVIIRATPRYLENDRLTLWGCSVTRNRCQNSSPYSPPQPGLIPPSRSVPTQVHRMRMAMGIMLRTGLRVSGLGGPGQLDGTGSVYE